MYLVQVLLITSIINAAFSENDEPNCGCGNLNRNSDTCSKNPETMYSKAINDNKNVNNDNNFDKTDMVLITGGTFEMGTNKPVFVTDHEGPLRNISLTSYYIDKYEVSNQNFLDFVQKSGYKSEAENFGDSFVFEKLLPENERVKYQDVRAVQAPWWIKLKGADWQHPEGPESNIADRLNHPVIHVSWNDARAYCSSLGKRLPSEAEWEMACRSGLRQKLYPWGNKLNPKGEHWANIWQGDFPDVNTKDDGFVSTSPVNEFPPNKFGLYNMAGNVWEWTEDSWQNDDGSRVKKGGSYLCHESYCWRYRCAARSSNTADSSAGNLGFRCAGNV